MEGPVALGGEDDALPWDRAGAPHAYIEDAIRRLGSLNALRVPTPALLLFSRAAVLAPSAQTDVIVPHYGGNQLLVWPRGRFRSDRVRVAVESSRPRSRLSGVDIKPEALRQARTRARLSLSQVAGTELSRQTVHLIEIGKNRPSMRSLRVITERLAIPIREVLVGPPESARDEGAVSELEALIRSYHYDQALEQGSELLHQVKETPARALVHLT